ncbi:helix-turn-helix domain-containing protein [Geomicrobium sp. JSM 1781026]|uniref:helix-turn-helix domain-containing protein n=1 Tax=Geomicrobium sp. JSM 1781026 TaxID=3344580 RepID=UPI0035C1F393
MFYKNNVKKLMKEREISLNKLSEMSVNSINTIRAMKNDTTRNFTMNIASDLAQALDCSIKDLIEDDVSFVEFDDIYERNKSNPLFLRHQIFSPDNVKYLELLFEQVGVDCKVKPYNKYRSVTIQNKHEINAINIYFNFRVIGREKVILDVIDFIVIVNMKLVNESIIKDALIKSIEVYARKINLDEIMYHIDTDNEYVENEILNEMSDLPSNFSYSFGVNPSIFLENNYKTIENVIPELITIWRKVLD